jgi:triacylglycerol lipase
MELSLLQLTLIILGILVLTAVLVYYVIETKIRRLEIQSYNQKCRGRYFELPLGGVLATPTLSQLLLLSLNVELSNCPALGKLPIPYGYEGKEFYGEILGKKRMVVTVLTSSANTIVIFTGTVFVDEWTEDFDITQVPCNKLGGYRVGDKTHKGFYNVYMGVRDQLYSYVSSLQPKSLYVTGHSLGGALSTLFAYDMYHLNPSVHTFASPRVFNISGAERYDILFQGSYRNTTTTDRIFNTEDIFTSLPLPVLGSEVYQHVGGGGISFTINLGSMADNHTEAYVLHFAGA